MTENKRFRMETIGDVMLPFIVDNSTAKKKSDTITTYHTYETHRKEKCLELVDLLNDFSEENKQLKMGINSLKLLVQNWEALDEEKDEQIDRQSQALKKLKKENLNLSEELDYYKTKCASLETGYIQKQDENWRLEKSKMEFANELGKTIDENEQLKHKLKSLNDNFNHLKRLFDEIEEPISDELLAEYSRIVVEGFND